MTRTPDNFDPDIATSDAERLLMEWYQQWWNNDRAPSKMSAALHVRTAMYFRLKQYDGDTGLLFDEDTSHIDFTTEHVDGHEITARLNPYDTYIGLPSQAILIVCTCNWTQATYREQFNSAMRLHWLAKKIEREALAEATAS